MFLLETAGWREVQGMEGVTPERGGGGCGGGGDSHGFWGPGESTTGVERPSTLMEGMCTWVLPLDRNWKESVAGLRGAMGLKVLQTVCSATHDFIWSLHKPLEEETVA